MTFRRFVLLGSLALLAGNSAQAWYGPQCYTSKVRKITFTLASIAGETAGDLQVTFDEPNQAIVRLESIRASDTVRDPHQRPAHEVVLAREADFDVGTFAITLTSPYSRTGFKYEFEIRSDRSQCQGAVVTVSGDAQKPIKKPSVIVPEPTPLPAAVPAADIEEKIPTPEPPLDLPSPVTPPAVPLDVKEEAPNSSALP